MDLFRKIAIIVGVLFITATVAGIVSGIFLGPRNESDYLTAISANENQVIISAFFYAIMAVAVAGIAIVIYPVLKKYNEVLAIGYVGARLVEGILFAVGVTALLTLITLSQEFVAAGAPDASYFQTFGTVLKAAGDWAYMLGELAFFLSALMLYYLLYKTKLVPQWLSGLGIIGAIIWPVGSLSLAGPTYSGYFYIIIFVQEMILAVWLIVKGFNPQVIKSKS
ncbi:MAG: DUF4386 domain-containing protein [Thermoplasmatales archaeon]|nr:MAG: DUF4386 domain-containing protein [Thermoplasmatales archaeon]